MFTFKSKAAISYAISIFVLLSTISILSYLSILHMERETNKIIIDILVGWERLYVTASIGIAFNPVNNTDPYVIIQYADNAMYAAKQLGKNMYQVYRHEED